MPEIDDVSERHKLLEELRHHHTAPARARITNPRHDAAGDDGRPDAARGV